MDKYVDNNFGGVGLSLEELYRISKVDSKQLDGVNFDRTFRQMETISIQIQAHISEHPDEIDPLSQYLLNESAQFVDKVKICIYKILSESSEFPQFLKMAEEEHWKRVSHSS